MNEQIYLSADTKSIEQIHALRTTQVDEEDKTQCFTKVIGAGTEAIKL